jgi:glutamate 5-kinase
MVLAVVAFDAEELPALIGRSSHHLPAEQRREVVHADDLVAVRRRRPPATSLSRTA